MNKEKAREIALDFARDRFDRQHSIGCKIEKSNFMPAQSFEDGVDLPARWRIDIFVPKSIFHEHGKPPLIGPRRTVAVFVDHATGEPRILTEM